MKTKKALDKLEVTKFEELLTVSKVISRIKPQDGGVTDQGVNITYYQQGMAFVKSNHVEWVRAVESCLKDRLKTDVELLTHAVTLLATNGWERSEKPSFGYTAFNQSHSLVPSTIGTCQCRYFIGPERMGRHG